MNQENSGRTMREVYIQHFSQRENASETQKEALKQALDIRKFEIDLYWKRAAYFWAFIAAAFAGYSFLQKDGAQQNFEPTYLVASLGFVFSLAWYFVNRGSKAWQRNWELQVDLLEDEVMGPLYKSGLNRYEYRFWDLTEAYAFSPTRINHILGIFVVLIWLFLMCRTVLVADWQSASQFWSALAISVLTAASVLCLVWKGRSFRPEGRGTIWHRVRTYE